MQSDLGIFQRRFQVNDGSKKTYCGNVWLIPDFGEYFPAFKSFTSCERTWMDVAKCLIFSRVEDKPGNFLSNVTN